MDTLFVPNENDFRRWIKEALKEFFADADNSSLNNQPDNPEEEPLLT